MDYSPVIFTLPNVVVDYGRIDNKNKLIVPKQQV